MSLPRLNCPRALDLFQAKYEKLKFLAHLPLFYFLFIYSLLFVRVSLCCCCNNLSLCYFFLFVKYLSVIFINMGQLRPLFVLFSPQ